MKRKAYQRYKDRLQRCSYASYSQRRLNDSERAMLGEGEGEVTE